MNKNFKKLEIKYKDRVIIYNLHPIINGNKGTVIGLTSENWYNTYIIEFDEEIITDNKLMPKFKALSISEFNLKKI